MTGVTVVALVIGLLLVMNVLELRVKQRKKVETVEKSLVRSVDLFSIITLSDLNVTALKRLWSYFSLGSTTSMLKVALEAGVRQYLDSGAVSIRVLYEGRVAAGSSKRRDSSSRTSTSEKTGLSLGPDEHRDSSTRTSMSEKTGLSLGPDFASVQPWQNGRASDW